MASDALDTIPAGHREIARVALAEAFGQRPIAHVSPITGGASGALVYRLEAAGKSHLLRIEIARDFFRDPQRTFACMKAAADAGVAPALRHADPATGVAIMDFVDQRPIADYPGGPADLASALGELTGRLHALPPGPQLTDYPSLIGVMLGRLRGSSLFTPGLLDRHAEGFERIRRAYRWDPAGLVSSHNDPNPRNILFDGDRMWLIDWELAYRNDPLTDIAILADNFAQTPELEQVLLNTTLGREADRYTRARLALMRQMTRLFYASIILGMFAALPREAPDNDLLAPSPAEFIQLVASGRLTPGTPVTTLTFGKVLLAAYFAGLSAPGFEGALAIAGDGV